LPKILDQEGYTSLFFKAYRSLEFDNTDGFTRAIGFKHRHSMDEKFIKNEDKPFIWGWGLQDNIFYQKYFSFLDELNEEQPDQFFFSMLTTVTNHMMFDKIPRKQRYLYKSPRNVRENYANSIYLSDRYLREFFKQLQSRSYLSNSIVIITGDNSYPVGEHGYISNEASYYNEFFKTPMLIVYTDDKESHRVEKAFSHVDIAPTLLEILDIETKHHFIGSSVLTGIKTDALDTTQAEESHSIYISQPHSGTFLGTIKYPYKYVQQEHSGREFLYNIESDPEERTNLIKVQTLNKVIQKLQQANKFHYFNQRVIEENRIWPGNDQPIDTGATGQSDIVLLE
jgi:phosphoglycerol transferase MdoB-like AlkP superfamily enzyme